MADLENEFLVDTDILYKLARYGLTDSLLSSASLNASRFMMLGAARFMIPDLIRRRPPNRGVDLALVDFQRAVEFMERLEPTEAEVQLAADIEQAARTLNLELDGGESLLCAALISRTFELILSGDKRAIKSASTLIAQGQFVELTERFVCLEQVITCLLQSGDVPAIRRAICGEPETDRAITVCFACRSDAVDIAAINDALSSYINDLKRSARLALAVEA